MHATSLTRTQLLIKISTLGRPDMLLKCLDSFIVNLSGRGDKDTDIYRENLPEFDGDAN